MWDRLKDRWQAAGGYREALRIALPLILSTSAWSVQHFVDRMFLTWYSKEAVAAAMPAGILNFTFISFFMGVAGYANTFVAQYTGAKQDERVGPSIWQGLYMSLFAGVFSLILLPIAGPLFRFVGHEPVVQSLETIYFKILVAGIFFAVAGNAISCLYTGRGKTMVVMWVNFVATGVNLLFDYLLIFGKFGFPEMGIRGAAWATVLCAMVSWLLFFLLMLMPENRRRFHTLRGWRFDPALFWRMLRFGFPNGMQFMLDVLGFSIFVLLVGKLGTTKLAATNIAFNINTLAFMPMIGFSIAVSTMVGQRLGEDNPQLAEKSAYSAFHLTFLYMGLVALAYVAVPQLFLWPYKVGAAKTDFDSIQNIAVVLLRFVAFYSLFDSMNLIFAGAIKGAGDTRFVMLVSVVCCWLVMVIPSYVSLVVLELGLYWMWTWATLYACVIGIVFWYRFYGGKWKSMRVIETVPGHPPAAPIPEVHLPDGEK